jgi:putative PIN family toxin of toxin-antitoxin system
MFVSESILAEYERVLRRPRLRLDRDRIDAALATTRRTSTIVQPGHTLDISSDESDNRFYECAEAADAHYLITGNARHFQRNHKSTRIVTPREFVSIID